MWYSKKRNIFALLIGSFMIIFLAKYFDKKDSVSKAWYFDNDGTFCIDNYNESAWGDDDFECKKSMDINYSDDLNALTSYRQVTIALLDSAINVQYIPFSENIWHNNDEAFDNSYDLDNNGYISDVLGWNFVDNSNIITCDDEITHATLIDSLLLECSTFGEEDSSIKVMNLVVWNDEKNNIATDDYVDAIRYAESNGAQICCICFNTNDYSKDLKEVIKNSNMLFVVSAGNDGMKLNENSKNFPTCYDLPNVISVAEIRCDGKLSKTSNYGNVVTLAAPGTDIFIQLKDVAGDYVSGTSFSTPQVAATAGLIYCKSKSKLSAIKIKKVLCDTVTPNKALCSKVSTGGQLNVIDAINTACK